MYRLLCIAFCWLIGSFPTSYFLVRALTGKDIRKLGSGNSGATNAARVLGLWSFFLIVCIDAFKAYAALDFVAYATDYSIEWILLAAGAVFLGNSYSIFLNFSGGKGVATAVGIIGYLFPLSVLCGAVFVFVCMYWFNRQVAIASLSAAVSVPVLSWILGLSGELVIVAALGAGWIWFRHIRNIVGVIQKFQR